MNRGIVACFGWPPGNHTHSPFRFEYGRLHLPQVVEPMLANLGDQLLVGDTLAIEAFSVRFAILDEDDGARFEEPLKPGPSMRESIEEETPEQEALTATSPLATDFASLDSADDTHSETSTTSITSGNPIDPDCRFITTRNRMRIDR